MRSNWAFASSFMKSVNYLCRVGRLGESYLKSFYITSEHSKHYLQYIQQLWTNAWIIHLANCLTSCMFHEAERQIFKCSSTSGNAAKPALAPKVILHLDDGVFSVCWRAKPPAAWMSSGNITCPLTHNTSRTRFTHMGPRDICDTARG